jgi:acyl-CoA dehydrogenase
MEIKELALEFAKKEMLPRAGEFDQKQEMPFEIFSKAWELGLVNTCIPKEYNGLGLSKQEE